MKICYIFRAKSKKGYSIENVFETVAQEVGKLSCDTVLYYRTRSLFRDISAIRRIDADVYHITGDVTYMALFLPRRKTTITVHDVCYFKDHKRTAKRYLFALLWYILPIWKVRKVTSISRLTKDDLTRYFRIKPQKIEVIENPLSLSLSRHEKIFNAQKPVILQLGTGWHKNLSGLIEAVRGMACRLEIVGNPDAELRRRMEDCEIEHNIEADIEADAVREKYRTCDIVYFASLSEGFGLPILEAQAVGRPVVTSDIPPMKEVAGCGAVTVNPRSPSEIRDAIVRLRDDEGYRNDVVSHGFANVLKYQPDIIARKYLAFYKSILTEA
jgi:glycosyltransferase involved in cell wall biosynthesis